MRKIAIRCMMTDEPEGVECGGEIEIELVIPDECAKGHPLNDDEKDGIADFITVMLDYAGVPVNRRQNF